MAQRLSAFVLAVVFGAVPVTAQICDARCAQHAGDPVTHEGHASHHQQRSDHHDSSDHADRSGQHHSSDHQHFDREHGADHQPSNDGIVITDLSSGCSQPHAIASESREVLRKTTAGCVVATVNAPTNLMSALSSNDAGVVSRPSVPERFISPLRI
jgi:hypothetical protein